MSCAFHTDCQYPIFAGRLAQLERARLGHWLEPATLAEPFPCHAFGYATIEMHGPGQRPGVITQSCWLALAAALDAAAEDAAVESIVLEVNSLVQQVRGYGAAITALKRASRAKPTMAMVGAAGGLAVPLAATCHSLVATAAAPIGFLDWGMFDGSPRDDDPLGRAHGMEGMLESRRVIGRFGCEILPVLRAGSIHGEQLEGRGVDWLSALVD